MDERLCLHGIHDASNMQQIKINKKNALIRNANHVARAEDRHLRHHSLEYGEVLLI